MSDRRTMRVRGNKSLTKTSMARRREPAGTATPAWVGIAAALGIVVFAVVVVFRYYPPLQALPPDWVLGRGPKPDGKKFHGTWESYCFLSDGDPDCTPL